MAKKSLFCFILFLLLVSGNIYFACRYFVSTRTEFQVEGDKNDFLCRRGSNAASVRIENGNIASVGAAAAESDFYWTTTESYFMLNYNCADHFFNSRQKFCEVFSQNRFTSAFSMRFATSSTFAAITATRPLKNEKNPQSAVVNTCGRWYITNETVDLTMEK